MYTKSAPSLFIAIQVGALYIFSLLSSGIVSVAAGIQVDSTHSPLATSIFSLVWIGIVYFNFKDQLPKLDTIFRDRISVLVALILFALLGSFYTIIVPLMSIESSSITWLSDLAAMGSDPIYIIPKALDILFQQLLIYVFIRALSGISKDIRVVSLLYAIAFGIAHLSLIIEGSSYQFALIAGVAALLSALVFPYLILRTRNGLMYTYALHWLFYVALALFVRL